MNFCVFFTLILTFWVPSAAHGQVSNEDTKLLAFDGATGDGFGQSIAIHDGAVVIGSYGDDDNGINSGSAYIMHLILDLAPIKLLANDGASPDAFGHSVAIGPAMIGPSNTVVAVVGAPNDSDQGSSSGSAYIFRLNGTQHAKLIPNDGALGDNFGVSVAIDNGIVVVGTPEDDDNGIDSGSAYLFDANTGAQIAKLLPNNGAANDAFGQAVAISGDLIAVSAPRHMNGGIETGSVYLFSASKASFIGEFSSGEGFQFEQFGRSIAVDNGFVAVGALGSQSAYIYNASTLTRTSQLIPSTPGNAYGWSIDIDGNKAVVGAISDPINGPQSGSAFYFNAFTGNQIAKLAPSDGGVFQQFGSSAGIHNDLLVVGARSDDDNGNSSGSFYVFDTYCPADLNGDGQLDFIDISLFVAAFNSQSPLADINGDNQWDFIDISLFVSAFTAGCP
jgi:hypothetical protein